MTQKYNNQQTYQKTTSQLDREARELGARADRHINQIKCAEQSIRSSVKDQTTPGP